MCRSCCDCDTPGQNRVGGEPPRLMLTADTSVRECRRSTLWLDMQYRPPAWHPGPAHPPDVAGRLAARLAISEGIQQISQDVLQITQGSLYPALHRLEHRGWMEADWAVSELGRRAKYYRLTPSGRRQLAVEAGEWERMVAAIGRVMKLG